MLGLTWRDRLQRAVQTGIALLILMGVVGCADTFMGGRGSDPRVVFDAFWTEFDRTYPSFPLKGVDWDSVRTEHRSAVTSGTSDRALFETLAAMTATLRDGHAALYTPIGTYHYSRERVPIHFDADRRRRTVGQLDRASSAVWTGELPDGAGYLHVSSFGAPASAYAAVESLVDEMADRPGIVVDVRQNSGGAEQRARQVAQSFVSTLAVYGYVRSRNGPEPTDLTAFQPQTIAPGAAAPYTKPVAVITNRRCVSSCEAFVRMMRSQPHVTVVGDTTGGSSGNPTTRDLPNGWVVRVPRWIAYTTEKVPFEERGLFPDVVVGLRADEAGDSMLLRASAVLSAK
jgi:hypothetical protein